MKTENASELLAAIATACCLGLLPGCATSDSDSRPKGDLADPHGTTGVHEDETSDDGETEVVPTSGDEGSETGHIAETDDSTGEVEGETDPGETTGGEDDGTTGGEPPMAELDGDSEVNPAVRAQFRATSPAPVSVDGPLFNDDAIDTIGLQYQGEVSNPGDQHDFVVFNIVPGQVDPTIRMFLDCGQPGLGSDSVRAHLFHEDGTLLETVVCGDEEQPILLEDANSDIEYRVRVEVLDGTEQFDTYSLEIDGYCFQGCEFQPYGG